MVAVPILCSSWYRDLRRYRGDFKKFISDLRSALFDGIELSIDYPLCFKEKLPTTISDAIRHEGMYLSFHLPWRDIKLASPLESIRKASIDLIIKCIDELSSFDPLLFVIHLNTEQDDCGYMCRDCVEAAIESIGVLSDKAAEVGIPILIETTHEKCCSSEDTLPYVIDTVKQNPYIGVCLDPLHLLSRRIRKLKRSSNVKEIIRDLPPVVLEKVEELHIHGFKYLDFGLIYVHLMTSDELVKDIINAVDEVGIKSRLRAITLEVYKDSSGNDVRIHELRDVVELIKGMVR